MPESADRAIRELAIHATLAPALMAVHGWGSCEAHKASLRAKELSETVEEPLRLPTVLAGLATVFEVRGDYRHSQALLEEYLDPVADHRPAELVVESHDLLACSLFHQGDFARSVEYASTALSLYEPDRCYPFLASSGADPAVSAEGWAALGLWFLGFPDRAVQKVREALRRAENHVYSLALAQAQAAAVHQYRREPESVRELAGAAIRVADENGFPYWAAVGRILRGWGLAMLGEIREGIAEIHKGSAGCRTAGVEMDRPHYLALLAEAYLRDAQPKEALSALDDALSMIRNTRTFFYEAELHRLRGNVLMEGGEALVSDVETSLQEALRVARGQSARCLELRAAVSLARLWREEGKQAEAQELLAGIHGSFTEGFDTPDLTEARAILERPAPEQRAAQRAKLRGAGQLVVFLVQACLLLDAAAGLFRLDRETNVVNPQTPPGRPAAAKRFIIASGHLMERRTRVLVAKPGLDGHDRGARVIARALRDAGMEVIYTGLRQTPEMIVNAALQEDVQVIGLSILSGAHMAIVPRVVELLREREMTDVVVIVGGIIPDDDARELTRIGVARVFQPGAALDEITGFIRDAVKQPA